MSGFPRMNEFEDPFRPARRHIEQMDRITRASKAARETSNKALAVRLYEIAEGLPDSQAIACIEAAERLAAPKLTETEELPRN